nr:NHLP bacteriocin system secretion protein [uncultured Noviherbaspirillum sp.]
MKQELFRKAALENLSMPERLDAGMQIARPRAWIALATILLLLLAAVAWSIAGSLPASVEGQGIIIREGGTFNIVSFGTGVITEMTDLKLGEPVRRGQMLGRLAQPEMQQQIDAQRIALQQLTDEEKDTTGRMTALRPVQENSARLQQAVLERSIVSKQDQLRSLRVILEGQQELLRDGLITRQRYEQSRQQALGTESDIDQARTMLQKLLVEQIESAALRENRLREIGTRVLQARNRLGDLMLQHELASKLVSPHDGIVVETMAMKGDAIRNGQPVLSIEVNEGVLEAVVYLPPNSNAKLLKPGMPAQISPVTAKKERFGYLVGTVRAVAQYPATEAGMLSLFNNAALVRELTRNGPPIAVEVVLNKDAATRSGYRWSSRTGAAVELSSGTLASGTFVVESKRPITLLVPLLRELTGT